MAPVGPDDEEEEKEEEEATLVRANRAIESAERRCHFWCDAKTLQWQLKVITRAINAATAAATATAKKTHTDSRAGLEWQQPKMAKRKNRRDARKAKAATRKKKQTQKMHVIYLSSIGWQ